MERLEKADNQKIKENITFLLFQLSIVFLFFPWGFVTPLLVGGGAFFEYRALSYVLILLMLIVFLISTKEFKTKKSSLSVPIILLAVSSVISLWERASISASSEFFIYLCCVVGLGFIANYLGFDQKNRSNIAKILLFMVVLLAIYGLVQVFLIIPSVKAHGNSGFVAAFENRMVSVLTSPSAFASVLILVFPLSIYFYHFSTKKHEKYLYGASLLIILLSLLLTGSKSGIFALILELILIFLFSRRRGRQLAKGALILAMAIFLLILVILIASASFSPINSSFKGIKTSFAGRLSLWKTALNMFYHFPFTGFGANTFKLGIYKFQHDGFYSINAHSTFIQAFSEVGVLGGIAVLSLFLYIVLKCCIENKTLRISKFIGFGLVGFSIMNLFDSLLYTPLVSYLFAVLVGLAFSEVDVPEIKHRDFPRNAFIMLFVLFFVISVLVLASYYFYLVGKDLITVDFKKSIKYLSISTIFNPVEPEYHRTLASAYTAGSFSNKAYRYMRIIELRRTIFLEPYNPINYFELGYFYETEGQIQLAAYFYKKAIECAPKQPYFYYQLGRLYLNNLRINDAKKYLLQAVSLERYYQANYILQSYRPGNVISEYDPYLSMARAAYLLGNIALSNQKAENAIAFYTKAIDFFPKLAEAYAGRASVYLRINRIKDAVIDSEKAIELDPQNPAFYYIAALSYYKLGEIDIAKLYLSESLQIDPHYEDSLRLLKKIEEGEQKQK